MSRPFAISLIGRSGSGKTTLLAALIPILKGMGYKVSAIKHSGKSFEADKKGKDSWKFKSAGADGVILFSDNKIFYTADIFAPPPLDVLLDLFVDKPDIVLVESYKKAQLPSILVIGDDGRGAELLGRDNIIAIACEHNTIFNTDNLPIPRFKRSGFAKIAAFIDEKLKAYYA